MGEEEEGYGEQVRRRLKPFRLAYTHPSLAIGPCDGRRKKGEEEEWYGEHAEVESILTRIYISFSRNDGTING